MDNYQNNGTMDWNDQIATDDQYTLLSEGDYNFTVSNFERGQFPGSEKLPPCNKATLTLDVDTNDGIVSVKTDLILHKSLEWKLSGFFRCIGQKKHGEPLIMNWNAVPGAKGRAHFKPRAYVSKKSGNESSTNDIAYFIDYDPKFFAPVDQNPSWVQQARQNAQPAPQSWQQQPQQQKWQPGKF